MSIEPFSAAIIEVAKQGIKEIGKGISEGLKEGLKEGADKRSEGIKEKYLQNETPPVSEIKVNIPSELKEISAEVTEVEQVIDYQPENIVKNPEEIKANIESIETKINDFIEGFKENRNNGASLGTHADYGINNGVDILKDVNNYAAELKGRLSEAGVDVNKILDHLNSAQSYTDIDDADIDDSDFDESE